VPAAPRPPAAPAVPLGGPADTGGEFTRLFQQAQARARAKPAEDDSAAGRPGPGTFTRLFESPLRSNPIDVDAERTAAVRQDRPFKEASEFTGVFGPAPGAPEAPDSRAEAKPAEPAGDELGSVFLATPRKPVTPFSGSGEYAEVAARPAPEADAPPPAATVAVPVSIPARRFERKRPYLLWVGIAGCAAAAAAILFFILR
jgi:hypothetical protein